MSLATGARLGAYEIVGRLGAGAMGEVFRARDTRLGRDVAIKILPPALADSSERRRRFEQESRAAGALNHPNIVAVYDTGDQDGVSYIVSELVEGESLRELIRRSSIQVRKAIDIAAQIADGLAVAHSAGIVHRDLKPENVMLTRDGRVKILDFGLARYQSMPAPADGQPIAGTLTMTNPGMIMGTPGYMSPEQVAGSPVDERTDIFSLGIMIYEMLTGKQAFERATSIETMSAILREDPPDLPATVPPALKAIVLHCLEKEPHRRYQSPHDLAFALRALSGSAITSAPSLPTLKARRALTMPMIAAAGVLALIAVYAIAGLMLVPRGADLSTYRFTPLASGSTPQGNPAWAPDGKSVAYIKANPGAADSLMVRSMESMLPVTVSRGDFNGAPFWSPDGARLFFIMTHQGVHSVSRAGGGHQEVLKGDFAAAALSPDGHSLVAWLVLDSHEGPIAKLWISSPPGAAPRQYEPVIWKEHGSAQPVYLRFSPDGREIAASITTANGGEVWLLPFPDGAKAHGRPRRAFSSSFQGFAPTVSWMPDNRNLVLSFSLGAYKMSQLWIGDTANGSVTPITSGESELQAAAVSPDGAKIAFQRTIGDSDIVQLPIEGGMVRPLLATSRDESAAAWSPVAPQFAYVTSRNGRPEIWIESTQEGWERPVLTQHDFPDDSVAFFSLSFSPEGDRLAYMRMSAKRLATLWISPAAGGEPVQLSRDDEFGFGPTWSPDGNFIAYTSSKGGLVKIAVGSSQAPVSIREKGCQYAAQWSPDGQWIACPDNGRINLISPDGKTSRMLGSRAAMVTWSRDSKFLFTLGQDETQKWLFASIDVRSGAEKTLATLGAESNFWASFRNASMISLAPDGKSVAATKTSLQSEVWLLEGFPRPRGWLRRILWWR
jgi:eukaryotic-like serine/threonine-protein kinase